MGYMTKLKFAVDTKPSSSYDYSKGTGYLTGNSKLIFSRKGKGEDGMRRKLLCLSVMLSALGKTA